jgi:hypothetical protein
VEVAGQDNMAAYFNRVAQVQVEAKVMARMVLQDCKDHLEV